MNQDRLTSTFAALAGPTRHAIVQMLFETADVRNKTVEVFNTVEGLQQALDRLAEQLKQIPSHAS